MASFDTTPQSIEAANTKAVMLKDDGKYSEARDYLHHSLRAARVVLGEEHHTTLSIITNLSSLLQLLGNLDEAAPLCEESLAGRRSTLGNTHNDTVSSMINMGSLHEQRDEFDKALPLRREALQARRLEFGDEDPKTLATLDSLAALLLRLGKVEEAVECLSEELEAHVKRFGKNCGNYLPPETKTVAAKAAEAMEKLADRGAGFANARARFFRTLQAALLPPRPVAAASEAAAPAAAVPPPPMTPEDKGDLLEQVLQLTPEQLKLVPADMVEKVEELRREAEAKKRLATAPAIPVAPPSLAPPVAAPAPAGGSPPTTVRGLLELVQLPQYIAAFEEEEMDVVVMREVLSRQGRAALEECLKELGVGSMGHRAKIANVLA